MTKYSNGGSALTQIKITLRNRSNGDLFPFYIDVLDNSLAHKWIQALRQILLQNCHLEKNYCFMGFPDGERQGPLILSAINHSIAQINAANLGYHIRDWFDMSNCIDHAPHPRRGVGRNIVHDKFNRLHRYFEDLQGFSGHVSEFYRRATADVKWHIRQLNLLCHEFESWALSWRKQIEAPEWVRPSMLMCWLDAPRFVLDQDDLALFGIEAIVRDFGGVYVGVNKAVGKHHWEVFNDEGKDSRLDELTTSSLRAQTEAAADFDIEWGRGTRGYEWQQKKLDEFRDWLHVNGFDPTDPSLTLGHPKVAHIDFAKSFGYEDPGMVWQTLERHFDVYAVELDDIRACYDYHWSDTDYQQRQVAIISRGTQC